MTEAVQDFIRRNLPLSPVPFVPEVRLHKAVPTSGLWRLADRDEAFGSPYWAYHWGGGLALARYLLDRPELACGRRVLDLGCGSGIVAIAAARAGACEVVGADVDPYAVAAAGLNAQANGINLSVVLDDLTCAGPPAGFDLVTVGDLFYDRHTAQRVLAFLRRASEGGADVLVGDPERAHLPHAALVPLVSYRLSPATGAADPFGERSTVFRLGELSV